MKAAAVASPFLLTCKGWLQYTVSDPTRPLGCGGPHVDRHVSVTYSLLFSGWTLLGHFYVQVPVQPVERLVLYPTSHMK